MRSLTSIKEVLVICFGSTLSFHRIGKTSTWRRMDHHVFTSSALHAMLDEYEQHGKALIILVQSEEPDSTPAFKDITIPAEAYEVRVFGEYGTMKVEGATFWRGHEPGKWNRMERNGFGFLQARGSWTEGQLKQYLSTAPTTWTTRFYTATCEPIDIKESGK